MLTPETWHMPTGMTATMPMFPNGEPDVSMVRTPRAWVNSYAPSEASFA